MQPIVIQAAPSSNRATKYKSWASYALGGLQLAVGLLCIILNIAGILVRGKAGTYYYYYASALFFVGHGIWGGTFFIITGSIGIAAGSSKRKCLIITFMVLSILCVSLFVPAMISVDATAIDIINRFNSWRYDYDSRYYGYRQTQTRNVHQVSEGLHGTLLTLALIEFIAAILSSVLACHGVCGCCGNTATSEGQFAYVQYANGPQQVIMLAPAGGQHVPPTQYVVQPAGQTPTPPAYYPVVQQGAVAQSETRLEIKQAP